MAKKFDEDLYIFFGNEDGPLSRIGYAECWFKDEE